MPKSTREMVFDAAEALLKEGVKPSQQNVRDRIGKGSATTIHKALNEWWGGLSARLDHQQKYSDVPDFLSKTLLDVWQQALERSQAVLEKDQQAIKDSLLQKQSELDELTVQSQQRTEKIASQLAQAYDRIDEQQQRLDQLQADNLELEKRLVEAGGSNQQLTRQNKTLEKIVAQLERRLNAEGSAFSDLSSSSSSYSKDSYLTNNPNGSDGADLKKENNNLKATVEKLDSRLAEKESLLAMNQDELLEVKRRLYRLESNTDGQLNAKDTEIERLLALLADKR
ncbi:MAG: DNA-binding protein [Motiliproteus sp.]|nr:DNA-binding protein [Motiliproteus sp.]